MEKELDPQMAQLDERLTRIEALLEGLQRSSNGQRDHPAAERSTDQVED
jgi:hypothetical protein